MNNSNVLIIKKALLEVELLEIKALDCIETADFQVSEEYKNKIQKLIDSETKRENSYFKLTYRKKIGVLIAAVITTLMLLTACAFGEQIKDFLVDFSESMIRFLYLDDKASENLVEYEFTYIPDGYTVKNSMVNDQIIYYEYTNDIHSLHIYQALLSNSSIQIDNNDSSYHTTTFNSFLLHVIHKNNTFLVVWKNDTNVFSISCHDSVSMEEIEKIIASMEIK